MAEEKEYYLTEPTSRVAEKRMLKSMTEPQAQVGGAVSSDPTVVNAPYATEDTDTSGYIGVSSEYMTHANDTERPIRAEEGVEADLLDLQTEGLAVRQAPEPEVGEQTVGTGSTVESVYTATSGEDFSSKVVDPKSVEGSAENPDTPQPTLQEQLSAATPTPSVSASASTGSGSSGASGSTSSNE